MIKNFYNVIQNICGIPPVGVTYVDIGNDPNYVFENDPSFTTLSLFDVEGNIVNVNSWIECSHYVNGGWSNNITPLFNYERSLFFILFLSISVLSIIKYFLKKRGVAS